MSVLSHGCMHGKESDIMKSDSDRHGSWNLKIWALKLKFDFLKRQDLTLRLCKDNKGCRVWGGVCGFGLGTNKPCTENSQPFLGSQNELGGASTKLKAWQHEPMLQQECT